MRNKLYIVLATAALVAGMGLVNMAGKAFKGLADQKTAQWEEVSK